MARWRVRIRSAVGHNEWEKKSVYHKRGTSLTVLVSDNLNCMLAVSSYLGVLMKGLRSRYLIAIHKMIHIWATPFNTGTCQNLEIFAKIFPQRIKSYSIPCFISQWYNNMLWPPNLHQALWLREYFTPMCKVLGLWPHPVLQEFINNLFCQLH